MFVVGDSNRRRQIPVATGALVGINVVVFLLQLGLSDARLQAFFYEYGVVPLRYARPDWALVEKDMKDTFAAARDLNVEILYRDVYTINGDRARLRQWVDMTKTIFQM